MTGVVRKQKTPSGGARRGLQRKGWRRPTLPPSRDGSTIGAAGLNCRVRNGNGCGPCALVVSVSGVRHRGGRHRREHGWKRSRIRKIGRDQTSRAISTARLKRSRAVHLRPINLVVSQGPLGSLRSRNVHLGTGFPLRCFQRLSLRDIATGRCPWRNSPYTGGHYDSVLSY